MFRQIVVGVDEQRGSRDAIGLAKRLLAPDGDVTLAHVVVHDGHGYRVPSAAYEAVGWARPAQLLEELPEETGVDAHLRWRCSASVGDAVDVLVNEARDRLAALGGVEAHAAFGDAAEELALYSASLDLLIVGSRGYGPIGRLIHGSTSAKLARMARCALVVLPRAARAIEAGGATKARREPAVAARG